MKSLLLLTAACLLLTVSSFAQYKISGTVRDETQTLAGANVILKDSYKATTTNTSGSYTLSNLKAGEYTLVVSFIGYETQELVLQLNADTEQNITLNKRSVVSDEVVVSATRAAKSTATTYTQMGKEEIAKNNLGQDIPFLLQNTPSVIVTSDAGAGVGYTGINIRGSDATRINVTVNGIPINDSESHGMYWVNMPDLASSVENMQVQRGVGTSTNGAAAFGASINIQTAQLNVKPYAEISNSYGSFNTWKHTIKAGSGLLADHFTVDARLSKLSSDGYMDRATSDLKSYYLSAGYYGKNTMLRFVNFSGKEKTYQSWWGVPEDSLATNRTYNYYTYENETDNYQQDHYQLLFAQEFHRTFRFNAALHYTRGRGYYEQFRDDDSFSDYGLNNVITGSDTITTSDFIRQRWLDNHFYGITYSFEYNNSKRFSAILGGAANRYAGKHFGTVIWAQYASNSSINHRYYDNDAGKTDVNVYLKANYRIGKKLNAFIDLQYRTIQYSFLGYNNLLQNVEQQAAFNFFNPKAGLVYEINGSQYVYASYSRGNREPVRDDFTNSTPGSRPKHETLNNVEAGYKLNGKNFRFGITYYLMAYQNQLVLTGQINDVGAYTRTNIGNSYRTGIEPEFEVRIAKILTLGGNFTYSMNKIKTFTEFVDDYDTGTQQEIEHQNTDIAFSPNIIASGLLGIQPLKGLGISLISKYVGKQYLDNTSDNSRSIDAYFTQNVRINYVIKTKAVREIGINLLLNNVFNAMYEANGYTFSYIYGGEKTTENYYYPMAGFNFLAGLSLKF
ncbi:MAG: hypothetical protein POELPBGB_00353 [Bacteroidia bacterium]|nr:hypothetical protein [Bacteroidia bacterium]